MAVRSKGRKVSFSRLSRGYHCLPHASPVLTSCNLSRVLFICANQPQFESGSTWAPAELREEAAAGEVGVVWGGGRGVFSPGNAHQRVRLYFLLNII